MEIRWLRILPLVLLIGLLNRGYALTHDLIFQERLAAQEAIERVYYSHQIGATRPFEEAVPRSVIEAKVRKTLQQSAALERYWRTPVTSEALSREIERIARNSRFPDRLQEVYRALGDDPLWIQECFARPTLVDRLSRSFFAWDERIHASRRTEAEALREEVVRAGPGEWAAEPRRSVEEGVLSSGSDPEPADTAARANGGGGATAPAEDSSRVRMSSEEFRAWRARAPATAGEVGPVLEEPEAFVFRVVLEETSERARIATYSVPKIPWDEWWDRNRDRFPAESSSAVASPSSPLPVPSAGRNREFAFPAVATSPSIAAPTPGRTVSDPRGPATPALKAGSPGTDSENGKVFSAPSDPAPFSPRLEAASCRQGSWDNGSLDDFPDPRSRHTAVWTGTQMIIWGGDGAGAQYYPDAVGTGWKYDPVIDTWTRISNVNAPSPRTSHRAVWTGTEMIVWGGMGRSTTTNTGGRYNPATDTWAPTSTVNAPSPRVGFSAIWTGTEMIVYGGEYMLKTGGRYNPATDTWTPTHPGSGFGRSDHTAVWTGSLMLIWGGYDGSALDKPWKYDPSTDTWLPFSSTNQPAPRYRHGAVWTGSRMIIWGGFNGSADLTSGGQYDPVTDTWTSTSTVNAPTAEFPSSFWTGSLMVAWTGGNVSRYDPAAEAWTTASTLNNPGNRSYSASVWTGSQLVVWGGSGAAGGGASGGRYTVATDTWTPTSLGPGPSARQGHSAVWTGNEMIVWGGVGLPSNTFLNSGGRYDPLTDSWVATATAGAPSGRRGHTAVWTGQVMVVWGSGVDNSPTNTGGRYDPVADTWAATSISGAPEARDGHTAVWTGTRMIIWGGRNVNNMPYSAQFLNTGGVYDPGGDSWEATGATGVPAGRISHTAIWTGTRMIVWGGGVPNASGFLNYTNTGGLFNPQNGHWSAMSATGAPDPRYAHTAVWTGSAMVIWGGYLNGRLLHSGGVYDPQRDSWTPTSNTNAPLERYGHTAVWTGTEMVVWGGLGGVYDGTFWGRQTGQATGGAYDPATDSWTTTPASGAPLPRAYHSAVWTGIHMIVWGGSYLGSGGRLRFDLLPDVDLDQDGYGICSGDCNDDDPAVHPGAIEVCNHVDDNCAGGIDELFDQDLDGYATCDGDCDDANPARNPAATELCNHLDDNCNYSIDEGFTDLDADGWAACLDCDDFDYEIHPGAMEFCNGVDDDCNGIVDDGGNALCFSSACIIGTCHGSAGCFTANQPAGTPCNDNNLCTRTDACNGYGGCVGSNPIVCTPLDQCHLAGTCNGITGLCSNPVAPDGTACSDGDPCTSGDTCQSAVCVGEEFLPDADHDLHVDARCGGDDCNDADFSVYPGAPQICDGKNNDCSDPSWPVVPANEADADGDGWRICAGDCNDANPAVYPGAPQICDGMNDNCSDPSWPAVPAAEADADHDGFPACAGDCNDADPAVHPGAAEICNGIDDNCDGRIDEGFDQDGDGFTSCGGDCNDADPDVYPNAVEVNDGKDNQCPSNPGYGLIDEISGAVAFGNPDDPGEISWPAQPRAAAYEVVRATGPLFPPACGDQITPTPSWSDAAVPPPGGAFFYLVRSIAPYTGSWGESSSGAERLGLCGAESLCSDGIDNDGDGLIDCADPDCFPDPACVPAVFSFVDTPVDDIPSKALSDFFGSITAAPADYIFFSLSGPDVTDFAWCAERADFYRDSYLAMAVSGGTVTSGPWNKWSLLEGGSWTGPDTAGYPNAYSSDCWEGHAWCAESGLAGRSPVVSPEETGDCEAADFSVGCGSGNWALTIRVGRSRFLTCGF